jgi:hypothetical protein
MSQPSASGRGKGGRAWPRRPLPGGAPGARYWTRNITIYGRTPARRPRTCPTNAATTTSGAATHAM